MDTETGSHRLPHSLPCFLSWEILLVLPFLLVQMTKSHGAQHITPLAAWLLFPAPAHIQPSRACRPGHTTRPLSASLLLYTEGSRW